MRPRTVRRVLLPGALLAASVSLPAAQDPSFNAQLVGRFEEPSSSYADVWGEGDLAFLARFGQSMVDIVDVSDPTAPVLLSTYAAPPPDDFSSAQDVKSGDGLLFVAIESGGSNGVHIVDVRDPSNPRLLTTIDPEPGNFEFIHNVFYDAGWLYICNSSDETVALIDLRAYDPDNPPASIGNWTYQLTNVGNTFVHDITVAGGRLFCSAWDSLVVFDVTNLDSQPPQMIGKVEGFNSHAVWPTSDGKFLVTLEEREGGALRLYELVEPGGGGVQLVARDSYQLDRGRSYSVHNSVALGDRFYTSWYQGGGVVHELDRTSKTLELVASYDTSTVGTSGFAGSWGAFPLLGEDRVLFSDIENGLHVVDLSALQITFAVPRPEVTDAGVAETVTVVVSGLGNAVVDPTAVSLVASVNGGAPVVTPLSLVGPDTFEGELPRVNCDATVEWHVEATDLLGRTFSDPADLSGGGYELWAGGSLVTLFADDFETDQGWLVVSNSLSTGAWERAVPSETGAQPGEGDPDAFGSLCYVTGASGNSTSDNDVDGGPTTLFSPVLDFSGGDGTISYARWFFNDDGDVDALEVEISNDGGESWTPVEDVQRQAGGGWLRETIRVSEYVPPTATVRVRFRVSDNPNNSTTEAAIDSFRAEGFACTTLAAAVQRQGTGVNPDAYASTTLPVIGSNWIADVDSSSLPGTSLTYIVGFAAPLDPGVVLPLGELLVDVSSDPLLASPLAPGVNGVATHVLPIPPTSMVQGLEVFTQGLLFAPGVVRATNAVDLRIDY